jgi:hypothetical protein
LGIGSSVAVRIEEIQGSVGIVPDGNLATLFQDAIGLVRQQDRNAKLAGNGDILPGILRQVIETAIQRRTVRGDGNLERQNLEPLLKKRRARAGRFCLREDQASRPSPVNCCRQAATSESGGRGRS